MSTILQQINTELSISNTAKESISSALEFHNVAVPNLFIDYGDAVRSITVGDNFILSDFVDRSIGAIHLSVGIENIRPYAFANCKNLQTMTILSSVKTIGKNAFLGCDSIWNVDFNNNWTGSTNYIGLNYDSLYNSNTPISVLENYPSTISSSAFQSTDQFGNSWAWHCLNVYGDNMALWRLNVNEHGNSNKIVINDKDNIYLPDVIEGRPCNSVGIGYLEVDSTNDRYYKTLSGYFYRNLIHVSQHLESFGNYAFRANPCISLDFSVIDPSNYAESRNLNFGANSLMYLKEISCSNAYTTFTFPKGVVRTIQAGTFEQSVFKHIDIPDTVTKIDSGAFSYMEMLEELKIPDSVLSCHTNILYNCNNLKKLYVGKGIKYINTSYCIPYAGLSSLEDVTFACYLSGWTRYPGKNNSYLVFNLSSLRTLNFEDDASTLNRLSGWSYSHTLTIPSQAVINGYDYATTYSGKLNTITILSSFPTDLPPDV